MSTVSMSGSRRLAVWDVPTRLFHWLLVVLFAVAWLSGEEEGLFVVHRLAGYGILVAILFRLGWGVTGGTHARFVDFVRGPRAVLAHLRDVLRLRPGRTPGHNPVGGWMIIALLLALAGITVTGLLAGDDGLAGPLAGGNAEFFAEVHEALAEGVLLLVGLHVAGVLVESLLTRDNLVGAMLRGWKRWPEALPARDAATVPWWRAAVLLAMASGVVWWLVAV